MAADGQVDLTERVSVPTHRPPTTPLPGSSANPGAVAQLGERLVCNQEVEGSSPFGSIVAHVVKSQFLCRKNLLPVPRSGGIHLL